MRRTTSFQTIMKCIGYVFLFSAMQYAAMILASMVLGVVAGATGTVPSEEDLALALYRVNYEIMILSALLFLGVLILRKQRNFLRETSLNKVSASVNGAGVMLGLASYGIITLGLAYVLSFVPAVEQSQANYMEYETAVAMAEPSFLAQLISVCIMAPIVEEILCRGLILNTLKTHFEPKKAILIAAIFFAVTHGNLYQAVFTLPLGLLLGWMAHRFGSIVPSILIHALFNFSNYPGQIVSELGVSATYSDFVSVAWILLCFFAIPISYLLLKDAMSKTPPPPAFIPQNSFDFQPPFQAPYDFGQNQNPYGAPYTPPSDPPYDPPYGAPYTPPYTPPQETPADPQYQNDQGGSMAAPEYLIVGLGNPGDKYAQNRHNVGFMALDYIALRENVTIQNLRFKAQTGECTLGGKKVLLMKPQTFMNLSGESVREAAAFYKIPAENILVIFDDINFEPGVFRIRSGGSAGGHNGIKSIISCLGTDAFPRVKLGVGAPPPQWELMNWVLGNPTPEDQKKIIASLEDVYDSAKHFTDGKLDRAAALYNGKIHE